MSLTDIIAYVLLDTVPTDLEKMMCETVIDKGYQLGFMTMDIHESPLAFYARELFGPNVTEEYINCWYKAYNRPLGHRIRACVALYVPYYTAEAVINRFCYLNGFLATSVSRNNSMRVRYLQVAGLMIADAAIGEASMNVDDPIECVDYMRKGFTPALVGTGGCDTRIVIPRSSFGTGIDKESCILYNGFKSAGYELKWVLINPIFVQECRRHHLAHLCAEQEFAARGLLQLPEVPVDQPTLSVEEACQLPDLLDGTDVFTADDELLIAELSKALSE
jgi:hypothetical protein